MLDKPIKPVVLLIFDGFGIAPASSGNAITQANMPNFHNLSARYPHGRLQASGTAVGLTPGEVGSTEVGHLNLGAGRVVYQDLPRINMSISEGNFLTIPAFVKAVEHVKQNNSQLHLMGLVSNGNVHASIEHLYALMWFARQQGVSPEQLKIHAFLDGRDTAQTAGAMFLADLEDKIKKLQIGQIASIAGRYYAMDRDNRWDRIEKAYSGLVHGHGDTAHSSTEAIQNSYKKSVTDEFVVPTIILNDQDQPVGLVKDNDAVIFFNFRSDRPRELTKAFVLNNFNSPEKPTFDRGSQLNNLFFVTMTEYDRDVIVSGIAFPQEKVNMPLARVLSNHDMRHLHIAETEKERFTTFFFNGMREDPFLGEARIFIPSPKIPTYDLKPEMSSFEITETILKKIEQQSFDFAVINFAASDMVAHTGNLKAAIKACEALDICLGKIANAVLNAGGAVVLTADHGNAEKMVDEQGNPDPEHTNNPVPFVVCANGLTTMQLPYGILADVAPTILALMGVPKPSDMTGRNLLPRIN
ncbi:MAG: 2,3-bisphosphoglycerate-independent phosphoglycerate mutase [bacterium]|nr:2,3-bisphosphoglycerate-independent phosphoglycerate mutase [bacterium]